MRGHGPGIIYLINVFMHARSHVTCSRSCICSILVFNLAFGFLTAESFVACVLAGRLARGVPFKRCLAWLV